VLVPLWSEICKCWLRPNVKQPKQMVWGAGPRGWSPLVVSDSGWEGNDRCRVFVFCVSEDVVNIKRSMLLPRQNGDVAPGALALQVFSVPAWCCQSVKYYDGNSDRRIRGIGKVLHVIMFFWHYGFFSFWTILVKYIQNFPGSNMTYSQILGQLMRRISKRYPHHWSCWHCYDLLVCNILWEVKAQNVSAFTA